MNFDTDISPAAQVWNMVIFIYKSLVLVFKTQADYTFWKKSS